ncbi:signal peptidase I [Paenibacillus sp. y28]
MTMSRLVREGWEWIKSILIALVVVLIIRQFLFVPSMVEGHSMDPTLAHGEWLIVNKAIYLLSEPEPGEIAVIRDPEEGESEKYLVKRIVAGPGSKVEIRGGRLYIDGKRTDEKYTDVPIQDVDHGPYQLGSSQYFVMGDNRHLGASKDSRSFGPVDRERIAGRAQWIVWPLDKLGGL